MSGNDRRFPGGSSTVSSRLSAGTSGQGRFLLEDQNVLTRQIR
jgi:hypothetical protein